MSVFLINLYVSWARYTNVVNHIKVKINAQCVAADVPWPTECKLKHELKLFDEIKETKVYGHLITRAWRVVRADVS